MKGLIVKGISGFYYVRAGQKTYRCRARGIFKKEGITPATGDEVIFEPGTGEEDDGLVETVLPRKNRFIRPPIANVDCFAIVMAAAHPKPNLAVTDKFLIMAEKSNTQIIVCLNKVDLAKGPIVEEVKALYEKAYPVLSLSGITGEGVEALKDRIQGKRVALAGPSGAGKSTLLNLLKPEATAQTGVISRKTKKGRHTTRHCELFDLGGGAMIFDTPGFTSFDILEADEGELQHLYPELRPFIGSCRYDNCRHMKEPGCAVRRAAEDGYIPWKRYESYQLQMEEIQGKNRY